MIFSRNVASTVSILTAGEVQSEATPPKCQLALPEVEYLGHIISAEGIRPNSINIDAVRKFPYANLCEGSQRVYWTLYLLQKVCPRFCYDSFPTSLAIT